MLKGYSLPRSPGGRSSLVPSPPWHYVGDMLVIEYWADPDAVARCSRRGLEPHPTDRAGRRRSSPTGSPAPTAARSCSTPRAPSTWSSSSSSTRMLDGEEVTTCPYIWVDRDFALDARLDPGLPEEARLGLDHAPLRPRHRRRPGPAAGRAFGGTCAANDRRLAEATVTLENPTDDRADPQRPADRQRAPLPAARAGQHEQPAVHELVRSLSYDRSTLGGLGGHAPLELFEAPNEEHTALAPVRIGKGFRFTLGYSVDDRRTRAT